MQKLSDLPKNPKNPRKISDKKLQMLQKSMAEFGSLDGIIFNKILNRLTGGHQRQKVDPDAEVVITKTYDAPTDTGTVAEGYCIIQGERYPYREVEWSEAKDKAANIAANKGAGQWDYAQLSEWMLELDSLNFDMDLTLFDDEERENIFSGQGKNSGPGGSANQQNGSLSEKFMIAPFSVLNAREGWWQNRKRQWIALGIKSELGRGGGGASRITNG